MKTTTTTEMKRGDMYQGPGGAEGRFVGCREIMWIAWDLETYDDMCAEFDGLP